MSARTMHIAIDVRIDGEEIGGHVVDGAGAPRPFSGWVGLIGALDGLLAAPISDARPPRVRMCLVFATAEQASTFAASAALRDAGACGAPEIWVSHHDETEHR